MILLDTFRTVAPEFVTVADSDVNSYLELASNRVSNSIKETIRNLAISYLAAHMMTCARRKLGASGEVTNLQEGNLSISYNAGTNNPLLASTIYGKEYMFIIRSYVMSANAGSYDSL